jgi:hypothetical protein
VDDGDTSSIAGEDSQILKSQGQIFVQNSSMSHFKDRMKRHYVHIPEHIQGNSKDVQSSQLYAKRIKKGIKQIGGDKSTAIGKHCLQFHSSQPQQSPLFMIPQILLQFSLAT